MKYLNHTKVVASILSIALTAVAYGADIKITGQQKMSKGDKQLSLVTYTFGKSSFQLPVVERTSTEGKRVLCSPYIKSTEADALGNTKVVVAENCV